jgi:predicted 2-oxoglutarate/Fe(II)-dependent dioxygenase YbiX
MKKAAFISSMWIISLSITFNDDYEGGNFSFFDGEHVIKTKAGSVLMFPSNFMYPHAITPITRGTRYSMVTWFI